MSTATADIERDLEEVDQAESPGAKSGVGGFADFSYLYNEEFDEGQGHFKMKDGTRAVPIKCDAMPPDLHASLCAWLAEKNKKYGLDSGPRSKRLAAGTANFHDFHCLFEDLHISIYKAYVVCANDDAKEEAKPGRLIKKYFAGKKFNAFIPPTLKKIVEITNYKDWPLSADRYIDAARSLAGRRHKKAEEHEADDEAEEPRAASPDATVSAATEDDKQDNKRRHPCTDDAVSKRRKIDHDT